MKDGLYYENKLELLSKFSMLNLNPDQIQLCMELAKKRSYIKEHEQLVVWAKENMPPAMLFEKQEEAIASLFEAVTFLFVIANHLNNKLKKVICGEAEPKEKTPYLKLVKR
jgi:hypothetical protein